MEKTSKNKKVNMQKLLAPLALIILYIFFAITGNNFLSGDTLKTILESAYFVGFLAFGVTFVIITGGIDLSLGTVMMCSALIGGVAYGSWGWPLWAALILIPVVGLIAGVLNGVMISYLELPPFIATLGTMMMFQGFGAIITKVQTQRFPTIGMEDAWFKSVFFRYKNFPIGTLYLIGFFVLAAFLLNCTRFGRYTFAIGSNEESVRLSGINVKKWKTLVYMISGLFAGIGGVFYAATYTTVIPGTGNGQELNAIAGVVIGGTSMSGGSGTMVGTLIGVFIMSVLKNGLLAVGLEAQWQTFFTGVVVIVAVLMDIQRNKVASRA